MREKTKVWSNMVVPTFSISAACFLKEESLFLTVVSFPALAPVSTLSTETSGWRKAPDNWSITAFVNWRKKGVRI